MKCYQSRPGFELESPCPFPTTITITLRAPKGINTRCYTEKDIRSLLIIFSSECKYRTLILITYWGNLTFLNIFQFIKYNHKILFFPYVYFPDDIINIYTLRHLHLQTPLYHIILFNAPSWFQTLQSKQHGLLCKMLVYISPILHLQFYDIIYYGQHATLLK